MKQLLCVFLVLLLCLSVCGCQEKIPQAEALPKLPAREAEVIVPDPELYDNYVYGEIVNKLLPDVLELKLGTKRMVDMWGPVVYIVTDQADEWCVGDEIDVKFEKAYRPEDTEQYVRIIADEIHPLVLYAKPILYFYPEEPTICSAKVTLNGQLTCTYPEHGENGWENFTAHPDGTLVFPDGKEYYALYWEGKQNAEWDFSTGFCVRGEDTAAFLEWALAELGLNRREANEFIVYWLPLMQENPYNVISFQTAAYTDTAKLDISPAPDSVLRVFMAYYPSETEIDIPAQIFEPFTREGFTVVEWGGSPV